MLLKRKSLKLTKNMGREFENNVKSKIKITGIIKRKPTGGLGGGSEL